MKNCVIHINSFSLDFIYPTEYAKLSNVFMDVFLAHQNANNICLTYQNNLMMSRVKTFLFLCFPALSSLEISSICFDSFAHANSKAPFYVSKKIKIFSK